MEQLENAELLEGELVEAYRGTPYAEIRTREVEDGWVKPYDENYPRPYPYRVPQEPRSYVRVLHHRGLRHIDAKWDVLQGSEGGFTVLVYAEEKTYKIPIYKQVKIESSAREVRLSVS